MGVEQSNIQLARGAINRGGIDERGRSVAFEHRFAAVVISIRRADNEHRARGGVGKPGLIQGHIRFARAEIVPFTVCPDFDPRMVVIHVRPERRVALPRGNADGTQRANR